MRWIIVVALFFSGCSYKSLHMALAPSKEEMVVGKIVANHPQPIVISGVRRYFKDALADIEFKIQKFWVEYKPGKLSENTKGELIVWLHKKHCYKKIIVKERAYIPPLSYEKHLKKFVWDMVKEAIQRAKSCDV